MPQGFAVFVLPELFPAVCAFSSLVVIGHNNGFVVQQDPLHTAVWAGDDTDLFPEPGKDEVEHQGKDQQGNKGVEVCRRTFRDVLQQHITSNQVGQENICDKKRDQEKHQPFGDPLPYFFGIPGLPGQFYLCPTVPVDPEFYPPEHHFHKNGLGTNPPTKYTAVGYCKEGNEDHTNDHGDHKQVKILWPERETENIKAPFQHIEHEELVAIYFNKRRSKQKQQQKITHPFPIGVITATGLFGKNPGPLPFLIDCSYRIPEILCHCALLIVSGAPYSFIATVVESVSCSGTASSAGAFSSTQISPSAAFGLAGVVP